MNFETLFLSFSNDSNLARLGGAILQNTPQDPGDPEIQQLNLIEVLTLIHNNIEELINLWEVVSYPDQLKRS